MTNIKHSDQLKQSLNVLLWIAIGIGVGASMSDSGLGIAIGFVFGLILALIWNRLN